MITDKIIKQIYCDTCGYVVTVSKETETPKVCPECGSGDKNARDYWKKSWSKKIGGRDKNES